MTDSDKKEKMGAAELCYRLFVMLLSVSFAGLLLASVITAKAVVGNEDEFKNAAVILSSIFFALIVMSLATLTVCWVSMKKTGAANLMVSTLLMTVSDIFLLLNCKWVYIVYSYGSGSEAFVKDQVGETVESYYTFLEGVHLRWLLMGFAVSFIIILGFVSFFHLIRHRTSR